MIILEKDKLLFKLKEFYILEQYQVKLYSTQLNSFEGIHVKRAYERIIKSEQKHVNYFAQKLYELGTHPPKILGPAFASAGFITGKALDKFDPQTRYKLGITFENKAVGMYRNFINLTRDDSQLSDLTKHLWYFMIDEEFHQYWFKEHLPDLVPLTNK